MILADPDPRTAQRWAIGICAFTGGWGVLTGFAIFIMLHSSQDVNPVMFWLGLVSAAAVSFVVESLRESVRGNIGMSTPLASRIGYGLATILMLAMFELFVLAAHNAVGILDNPAEIRALRNSIIGPALEDTRGATRDLLVLAGLWVVAGTAVGGILGAFVVRKGTEADAVSDELRSGATGALAGAGIAPLVVIAYILTWRIIVALHFVLFEQAGRYQRIAAFLDPGSLGLYLPPHSGYERAFRVVFALTTAWLILPFAWILAAFALLVTLVVGMRWGRWLPLGVVLAVLLAAIVAPVVRDMRDLLLLPFMAAVVWVVPAGVLGLATPLLNRPSTRSSWWSLIATTLGIAVAIITVVRLHDARYLLVALVLFVVAGLFFVRNDIEECWPVVALCVATLVTGLSVTVVHLTASFHEVLAGVSRVNALPARVDLSWREKRWTDDVRVLERTRASGADEWYTHNLIQRFATAKLESRLTILDEAKLHISQDRRDTFDRIRELASEKQRVLVGQSGDKARSKDFYHSLDGIGVKSSEDEVMEALGDEYFEVHELRGGPFWKRYAERIDGMSERLGALRALETSLPELRAEALQDAAREAAQRRWSETGMVQKLEVSLAGSTAFWVTVGLLAAWALRRRGTESGTGTRT